MEQWCRPEFGLAIQDPQRRVLGRDVVPLAGVQDWRHAGQVGRPCRVTKCMRHPRRIGCWLPGRGCRRCCCWVSGSMSPRQMGQGGMAGGVAAPGCVQPRSVGGASSMCPPSSSVKLTKEMFFGHAVGKGKIHGGGDKEIQRRTLRLYWPASRYANLFSTCFFWFFHFAVLKSTFCSLQQSFFRPVVTRLLLNWPAFRYTIF